MSVIWSQRAVKSLHLIEDYVLREFGENTRLDFMEKAEKIAKNLEQFPDMGKMEPLLAHRNNEYHSCVITPLSKLIYYRGTKRVVIADIWETRREPKKLAKGL